MKTETFIRRPFEVHAVQVSPQNCAAVAEWCRGKVGTGTYKIAGFDTTMDTVLVPGNGPNKGKHIQAKIGAWVVEYNGNFRVYRSQEFEETFAPNGEVLVTSQATRVLHPQLGDKKGSLQPDELVQVTDVDSPQYGLQGQVDMVCQTGVTFPGYGSFLVDEGQLTRIEEYSPETKKIVAELEAQASENAALDRLNAMRQAAEEGLAKVDGVVSNHIVGQLFEETASVPEAIGDLRVGTSVIVSSEMAEVFSRTGEVVGILTPKTLTVKLDSAPGFPDEEAPIRFMHDELLPTAQMRFARVVNHTSAQHGWVGWVIPDGVDSDLVRVAFRSMDAGRQDKCFSYMPDEVEFFDLGHERIPTYPLPA